MMIKTAILIASALVFLKTISAIEIWPMPRHYVPSNSTLLLSPSDFYFSGNFKSCDITKAAVSRYADLTFRMSRKGFEGQFAKVDKNKWNKHGSNILKTLEIRMSGKCVKWPSEDMSETYELKVATLDILPTRALLIAKTPWGVLRGLETFSQMVSYVGNYQFQIEGAQILDFPRFGYRGLMVDTSRHFLSKRVILETIELMAQNKYNVFHWHIVDDPSFPYQSVRFPELSGKGAFNPNTHVYKPSDVNEIIEFARMRGIRVIPEFDTPGHTQSWGKGLKHLLTPCYDTKTGKLTGYYAINPILNTTYEFLHKFFEEIVEVFNDQYIHLGGDEVSFSCWKSNGNIKKFMDEKGFKDIAQVEDYYEQRLVNIIKSFPGDHQYMVWEEVFLNGVKLKPETIVHVWRSGYEMTLYKSTKAGYRTLLSSCWYLNYISYGDDWTKFYRCDPQEFVGTQAQKNLIIGGETCMWGEFVDSTNIISRTWPRASIPAERLWSSASVTDIDDADRRINKFRCLLLRRGYNAEPPTGPGFCPDDYLV
ncbi:HEXB (predicted) [Pycnogonum litorale]